MCVSDLTSVLFTGAHQCGRLLLEMPTYRTCACSPTRACLLTFVRHLADMCLLKASAQDRRPLLPWHATDECTSYRSRTYYASLALLLPLTFVLLGPLRSAHRARYRPHPLMMIVLALLFLPTPPAPLPFRLPCLSSSLLTELL